MSWWVFAVASALLWGLYYLFVSRLVSTISPIGVYWLPVIPLVVGLPFYYRILVADYHAILSATPEIKIAATLSAFISIIASIMFYKAIETGNVTYASLIQITYPIFIVLFAFLLFGQNQFNWSILVGGILILVGSGIIIYNN